MNNKLNDELEYSWTIREGNNFTIIRKLGKDLNKEEIELVNSLGIIGFNINKTKLTK